MPKPASTRPAYKMLTCIYLCRTLLFFAPYADFFRKDINHRHHHRPNHHHTIYDIYDVYTSYAFYNGDDDVCRDNHNMNNNAHANNYYDN